MIPNAADTTPTTAVPKTGEVPWLDWRVWGFPLALMFVIGLLGLGGEVTPFTSVEILGKLFPDYFGLMAGIRNLIQSTSGFLAFVLIPMWADAGSGDKPADYTPADWNSTDVAQDGSLKGEYLDPAGTSFALWMCALLGVASTVSNVVVKKILINVRALVPPPFVC